MDSTLGKKCQYRNGWWNGSNIICKTCKEILPTEDEINEWKKTFPIETHDTHKYSYKILDSYCIEVSCEKCGLHIRCVAESFKHKFQTIQSELKEIGHTEKCDGKYDRRLVLGFGKSYKF